MNIKYIFTSFLLFLCFDLRSLEYKLNLKQAIDRAKKFSFNLKESRENQELSSKILKNFYFKLLPSLNLKLSLSGSNKNYVSDPQKDSKDSSIISSAFSLSSPTFSFNIFNDYKEDFYNFKSSALEREREELKLEENIITSYYSILYEGEKFRELSARLEKLKSIYENSLILYERGLLSKVDMLSSKLSFNSLEFTILKEQNNLSSQMAKLKFLLGLEEGDTLTLEDDFYEYIQALENKDFSFSALLSKDLNLKTIDLELKKQENLLNKNIYNFLPKLEFNFGFNYPFFNFDLNTKVTSLKNNFTFSYGINLFVDLSQYLPYSQQQLQNQKINLRLNTLKEKYNFSLLELKYKLNETLNTIQSLKEEIKLLRLLNELLKTKLELKEEQYFRGEESFKALKEAEEEFYKNNYDILSKNYNLIKLYESLK